MAEWQRRMVATHHFVGSIPIYPSINNKIKNIVYLFNSKLGKYIASRGLNITAEALMVIFRKT